MKKAFAVTLAVLAHLSPIAVDFFILAVRAQCLQIYNPFPHYFALVLSSVLFGLLYCGALALLTMEKIPVAVAAVGFFASFFYAALFFFGYFYGWFSRLETFMFAAMFIPFWLVLAIQAISARAKAKYDPDESGRI